MHSGVGLTQNHRPTATSVARLRAVETGRGGNAKPHTQQRRPRRRATGDRRRREATPQKARRKNPPSKRPLQQSFRPNETEYATHSTTSLVQSVDRTNSVACTRRARAQTFHSSPSCTQKQAQNVALNFVVNRCQSAERLVGWLLKSDGEERRQRYNNEEFVVAAMCHRRRRRRRRRPSSSVVVRRRPSFVVVVVRCRRSFVALSSLSFVVVVVVLSSVVVLRNFVNFMHAAAL